jgi:hypothetical protein
LRLVASPPDIEREPDGSMKQLNRARSNSEPEPEKKPKLDTERLHLIEHNKEFKQDEDGEYIFNRTLLFLRQGDSFFHATTDKRGRALQGLELEALERRPIPRPDFCPEFKRGLTRIVVPPSPDVYVKRPSLISWDPKDSGSIAALVLQEAEVCEILKKHPHPSVAKYHGCLVEDGRIVGLCFAYYAHTITQWLNEAPDVTTGLPAIRLWKAAFATYTGLDWYTTRSINPTS